MNGTAIQTALQALEAVTAHLEKALAELTVCMYACEPYKITQHLDRLLKAWPLETQWKVYFTHFYTTPHYFGLAIDYTKNT